MSVAEEGAGEGRPGSMESFALGTCEWMFGWCLGDGLRRVEYEI